MLKSSLKTPFKVGFLPTLLFLNQQLQLKQSLSKSQAAINPQPSFTQSMK